MNFTIQSTKSSRDKIFLGTSSPPINSNKQQKHISTTSTATIYYTILKLMSNKFTNVSSVNIIIDPNLIEYTVLRNRQ